MGEDPPCSCSSYSSSPEQSLSGTDPPPLPCENTKSQVEARAKNQNQSPPPQSEDELALYPNVIRSQRKHSEAEDPAICFTRPRVGTRRVGVGTSEVA